MMHDEMINKRQRKKQNWIGDRRIQLFIACGLLFFFYTTFFPSNSQVPNIHANSDEYPVQIKNVIVEREQTVFIGPEGTYKFVLASCDKKFWVKGCPAEEGGQCYHPDAYKYLKEENLQWGKKSEVLGGGRITREEEKIYIFGYSKTFGKCQKCNEQTCVLVHDEYPDHQVFYSNKGYDPKSFNNIEDWEEC